MEDHIMTGQSLSRVTLAAELSGIKDSITRLNRLGIAIRSSSRSTVAARARKFASQRTDLTRLNDYEEMAHFTVDCLYPRAEESLRRQLG